MLGERPIFAYVPVSDLERGRAFYEGKLELKPLMEVPGAGVSYRCANDTSFFMYLSEGAGTNKASTAFWMVDEIDKEVTQLKERGVVFQDYDQPGMTKGENNIYEAGPAKAAWFTDPDGNILALIQGP